MAAKEDRTAAPEQDAGLSEQDELLLKPRNIILTIPNFISLLRLISIPPIAYMIST